jgi:hypothetical protein
MRTTFRLEVVLGRTQLPDVQTTLNIYTHVVDASHRAAIEQLERQLFPTVPKSEESTSSKKLETATKKATEEAPAAASERRREIAREPAYSGLK